MGSFKRSKQVGGAGVRDSCGKSESRGRPHRRKGAEEASRNARGKRMPGE